MDTATPAPLPSHTKPPLTLRLATLDDIPALIILITASVRTLHAPFYTPAEIEGALATVYGTDTTIVKDGNYFAITTPSPFPSQVTSDSSGSREDESKEERIIACGGWSFRSTLYGGDQFVSRDDNNLLNPETDAAKIRALFVHPDFTKMGIGGMLLEKCEGAAREKGFRKVEMGATFAGVGFYRERGYEVLVGQGVDGVEERKLENGEVLRLVRMGRSLVEGRS